MRNLQAIIIALVLLIPCSLAEAPEYSGAPIIQLNNNIPCFTEDDIADYAFVEYSPLDEMGRVGVAIACIGPEFPVGARSSIFTIQPTGWKNTEYDFIPGRYLYNRSHLIAHRFSGGGEVTENLFTGTRFLNKEIMAVVETTVANYVARTGNHVLYRVTPDFRENELVCRGIEIEAQSVEDEDVAFHVYIYNIEPGIAIDYRTGENRLAEYAAEIETRIIPTPEPTEQPEEQPEEQQIVVYVLNTNTRRFHLPSCHSVTDMKPKNRKDYTGTREELINQGYKPCGECKP